jgi:hypothetical protein
MTTALVSREPVKVIADILMSELGLDSNHIILEYEKINIPPDQNSLYVALTYISGKAIGNNNYAIPSATGMTEIQEVAMQHIIQIDIMSFGNTARLRKEEVIMALYSLAAKEAMDRYCMKIARIPTDLLNASNFEATKLLNRYVMTIPVFSIYSKTKDVKDYYTTFPNTILDFQDGNKTEVKIT